LSMELYHSGVFGGSAVAKLSIFVSEYEFWCYCQIRVQCGTTSQNKEYC
jgi:hypothetical protein